VFSSYIKFYYEISILPSEIEKGAGTGSTTRKWKNKGGTVCDQTGHILARSLGGPNDIWNVYPQNAAVSIKFATV
jgi:hypothetical protein